MAKHKHKSGGSGGGSGGSSGKKSSRRRSGERRSRDDDTAALAGPSGTPSARTLPVPTSGVVYDYYDRHGLLSTGHAVELERKDDIDQIDAYLQDVWDKRAAVAAAVPSRDEDPNAKYSAEEMKAMQLEAYNMQLMFLRSKRVCILPPTITDHQDPKYHAFYISMDSTGDGTISYTEVLRYFEDESVHMDNRRLKQVVCLRAFNAVSEGKGKVEGAAKVLQFYLIFNEMLVQHFSRTDQCQPVVAVGGDTEHYVRYLVNEDGTNLVIENGLNVPVTRSSPLWDFSATINYVTGLCVMPRVPQAVRPGAKSGYQLVVDGEGNPLVDPETGRQVWMEVQT